MPQHFTFSQPLLEDFSTVGIEDDFDRKFSMPLKRYLEDGSIPPFGGMALKAIGHLAGGMIPSAFKHPPRMAFRCAGCMGLKKYSLALSARL